MKKQIAFAAFLVSIPCMVFAACSSSSSGGNTTPSNDAATVNDTSVGPGSEAGPGTDGAVPSETWTWIPVAGAICRDGTATGMGVNINPGSTKVMIFMEGGGACFNSTTCSTNPSTYGASDFAAGVAAAGPGGFNGAGESATANGIMSRNDTKNPVADWSYIYIPYCTGDVHAGGNPSGTVTGVTGTQNFAGFANVTKDLAIAKAMLPNTTQVLLTGISGGGFGAIVNYEHVAEIYDPLPVTMIDDSGPPMEDPYLPSCLQETVTTLWGLDKTVLPLCGTDCESEAGIDSAHFAIDLVKHFGKKYPTRVLGLIESEGDGTISSFFGFGADNCTTFSPELAGQFTAGLLDIRSQMAFDANFGSFYFTGVDHTSLENQLDTREAGDAGTGDPALSDWMTQMIAGTVTNVGP